MISPKEAYTAFSKAQPKHKAEAMAKLSDKGYIIVVEGSPEAYEEHMFFVDGKTKEVLYYSPSEDFDAFLDAFEDNSIELDTVR